MVVDGEQAPKSRRLQGGEDVEFEPDPRARSDRLAPEEIELRIAHEDEHLLVVDKPAGVVVHPSPGHKTGHARARRSGPWRGGRRRGASRDRPSARPRHFGPAGGRAVGRVLRASEGARQGPWARADIHGARPRPAAFEEGQDRGADRPRSPPSDAPVAEYRQSARGGHAFRARGAARPARAPPRRPGDRQDAPDPSPPRRDRASGGRGPGLRSAGSGSWPPVPPCDAPGVRASRSPASGSRSSRRFPASSSGIWTTSARIRAFRTRPGGSTSVVGAGASFAGSTLVHRLMHPSTNQGGSSCPLSRCESCWRPASISVTRRAAGTQRCAASSSRSAAASTSSTCRRRPTCSSRRATSSATSPPRAARSCSSARRSRPRTPSRRRPSGSACRTSTTAGSAG